MVFIFSRRSWLNISIKEQYRQTIRSLGASTDKMIEHLICDDGIGSGHFTLRSVLLVHNTNRIEYQRECNGAWWSMTWRGVVWKQALCMLAMGYGKQHSHQRFYHPIWCPIFVTFNSYKHFKFFWKTGSLLVQPVYLTSRKNRHTLGHVNDCK